MDIWLFLLIVGFVVVCFHCIVSNAPAKVDLEELTYEPEIYSSKYGNWTIGYLDPINKLPTDWVASKVIVELRKGGYYAFEVDSLGQCIGVTPEGLYSVLVPNRGLYITLLGVNDQIISIEFCSNWDFP